MAEQRKTKLSHRYSRIAYYHRRQSLDWITPGQTTELDLGHGANCHADDTNRALPLVPERAWSNLPRLYQSDSPRRGLAWG